MKFKELFSHENYLAWRCRRKEGERLAFYVRTADTAFWDKQWKANLHISFYKEALKGKMGNEEKTCARYLPRRGHILEAGCGSGRVVLALRKKGYDCEGVDWANETIDGVKHLFPDLPVRVGDVTHLGIPDGFYDAYISLGVMERAVDGPEAFLCEAQRIFAPNGIALINVPCFHALRRIKSKLGFYREPEPGEKFYQYAFTLHEFSTILVRFGFKIIKTYRYGAGFGLANELPGIQQLLRVRLVGGLIWRSLENMPLAGHYFGHLLFIVALRN
jgi:SAM-dependent methyltransferase